VAVIIVCVAASTALSLAYAVTAPRIAEQDRLAEERSLQAVLPDADDFVLLEDQAVRSAAEAAADPAEFKGVFRASSGGADAGWAVKLASRGYGGPVQMVIGLDSSGKVTGVSVLTHNETPGLGTKIFTEKWFMEQFMTLPAGYGDADVRGLDTISGVTRSSNAVRNGVAAAGRIYANVLVTGEASGDE
jgi:electron transport complex protein RnfG